MISRQFFSVVNAMPSKEAIVCGEQRLTYRELGNQVTMMIDWLRRVKHCARGHAIVATALMDPSFVALLLACADVGVACAPVSPTTPRHQRDKLREKLKASDVLTSYHSYISHDVLASYDPLGQPEDPFLVLQTSGTTSDPKPLVITQQCKENRIAQMQGLYSLTSSDRTLVATPLFLSLGLRLALMPLLTGGTSIMLPNYKPKAWMQAVLEHDATFTASVPAQLAAVTPLLKHRQDHGLRCVMSTSAGLTTAQKDALLDALPRHTSLHECYGTAEVAIATDIRVDSTGKGGFVGRAAPMSDFVLGPDGEISVLAHQLRALYWGEPFNELTLCQLFHTGDLGKFDPILGLRLIGRKKEIINRGGATVFPQDIEHVAQQFLGVKECAAFSLPDKQGNLGEVVGLAVVPLAGSEVNTSNVRAFLHMRLADCQMPTFIFIVDRLPKTEMGKIQRRKLTEKYS